MIVYLLFCVEKCASDVKTWMTSNKLQMNEDKTVPTKQIVNLQHLPEFMNINDTCVKLTLQLGTWVLLSIALFRCINMS